ncbi:MAG: TonB-dependent receptor [Verrucomicrobia bacterium]|nr:TonB-dependent receptor [Verrucomicrobiota bacterium]
MTAATCALGLLLGPVAFGQGIVSSGITGLVRNAGGQPIAGATITAVHTPTGTTYSAVTSVAGRYNFSGMVVGGPYTVSAGADGYKPAQRTDISTQLGATIDVSLRLESSSEVVRMEKFTVQGASNDLDAGATGAGSIITSARLAMTATVQRSFADMATKNQFVTLRSVLASRAQPIISAVGQNNRFNSVQVDGARVNDQFGLNGSGLQGFGNPITLDTVEQLSVSVSPYDVGQSGFTGVSINAVTKSGTNRFSGSGYSLYTSQDYQGKNVFGSTAGIRPTLEQKTKGFTFGGPILKNRLFFFINYERFDSVTSDLAGLDPTGTPQGAADMAAITARLAAINSAVGGRFDFGTLLGRTAPVTQYDKKKLAKLDWNISGTQRFSVRYNKTEGALPDSGKYKYGGSVGTTQNPTAGTGIANATYATNLSSNRFTQVRSEEIWAGQLFSRWTPELKTELRYAKNDYTQETPTPIIFPEIHIYNVSGVASSGANIGNGALVFGTELNRHGNRIAVNTESYSASGEYIWNQFIFTAGYDREKSGFLNLFRNLSYGIFDFASPAAFAADTPAAFIRNYYVRGTNPNDVSDFAINGLFTQAKWNVTPLLTAIIGLRYDWFTAAERPPLNPSFKTIFGKGNDGTVDGSNAISPRVSFNWAIDDARTLQLRGGVGHFTGRIPWVMVSNSYGNSGVGRSAVVTLAPSTGLVSYLRSDFDPANPIGSASSVNVGRPVINLIKEQLDAPSVWRGNLAADLKLRLLDSLATVEVIHSVADQALFVRDLNIQERFVGSDGRQVFRGTVNTAANAIHPEFSNVYEVSNVSAGGSTYVSFSLQRPMKNKWSYNVTYTLGKSTDVLLLGETVAGSQFGRNPVFNQNRPQLARSAFEIRNRIQVSLAREFEFVKGHKTSFSLYYEGRTGNPYTFVYSGDANGDGVNANDLVYVPTGTGDPVLAALAPAAAQSYMDYVNGSPLGKYRGGIAPRNAFSMPWVNRLDLHVAQTIPLHFRDAELEIFADFVNFGSWFSKKLFGYTETITGGGDNELLTTLNFGNATYTAAGQLQMTGAYVAPAIATPNNELSRWRIQFGARLKF